LSQAKEKLPNEIKLHFFTFVGHGEVNKNNEAVFLLHYKCTETLQERIQEINIRKLAERFAECENTINIFLFSACRGRGKGKVT
jgi:hypothetical protein